MKVAILGAGAMGSMIGTFVKKGGAETYFVDPYEAHMKAVQEKGLEIALKGRDKEIIHVDLATTDAAQVGVCDIVILLVKGMNTTNTIKANMALIGPETVVLTLQNGYGNTDLLAELLPKQNIAFGVLKCSATLVGPGRAFGNPKFADSHYGVYFYALDPETPLMGKLEALQDVLKAGGFEPCLTPDAERQVWKKLSTNAIGNIPCALIQVSPQDLVSHEHGYVLYRNIVKEVCAVATAKGIPMDFEEEWQENHVSKIPPRPVPPEVRTFTSAIHDVSRKHRTECDFLNGAIYREGQKYGIPTPYNETVWRLMKVLEDHYDLRYVPEK